MVDGFGWWICGRAVCRGRRVVSWVPPVGRTAAVLAAGWAGIAAIRVNAVGRSWRTIIRVPSGHRDARHSRRPTRRCSRKPSALTVHQIEAAYMGGANSGDQEQQELGPRKAPGSAQRPLDEASSWLAMSLTIGRRSPSPGNDHGSA